MIKGEIVYINHVGRILHLYVRCTDGIKRKLTITNFYPYFYVPDTDGECMSPDGKPLKKIVVNSPGEVRIKRDEFKEHYEADIRYPQRFIIDADIYSGVAFSSEEITDFSMLRPVDVNVPLNIAYFDIEESQRTHEIICFTLYVPKFDKYFTVVWRDDLEKKVEHIGNWSIFYLTSERELLMFFIKLAERLDFDILSGYYLTEYDYPKLMERLGAHNLRMEQAFDIFDIHKAYYIVTSGKKERYHLKDVVINEGIEEAASEVLEFDEEWWHNDLFTLLKYNKKDVEWCYKLDRKYRLFERFRMKKKIAGLAYFHDPHSNITVFAEAPAIDVLCLREAKKLGIALPSKKKHKKVKYEGAFVYLKAPGLYYEVANYDFSQYYPSIILSFNIDPLILSNYYKKYKVFSVDRYIQFAQEWVDSGNPTIYPAIVKTLQTLRRQVDEELEKVIPGTKEYEDLTSYKQAVKGLVNSTYGVLGYEGFRWYCPELAGMVTGLGREGIMYLKDAVKKEYDLDVIYCDTDSLFLQIPFDEATEFSQVLTDLVNQYFEERYGVKTQIKMKFEKFCQSIFFEAKKHYSAWITFADGKQCDYIDIKGSEAIRRDESKFTRDMMKEFYELLLKKKNFNPSKWLTKKIVEFKKSPLEDIVIPETLRKNLSEYKQRDATVRGAIYANKYLGCNITKGRVYMLYVKGIPGYPPTDVIAVDDVSKIPENVIIDWKRMIERSITSKIEKRFAILGVGLNYGQSTLF
jgi:DNA polymerase I